jgi:hypothetical protein
VGLSDPGGGGSRRESAVLQLSEIIDNPAGTAVQIFLTNRGLCFVALMVASLGGVFDLKHQALYTWVTP